MNNSIKAILENSAWYAGRNIDISYMLEEAETYGKRIIGEGLKRFLAEFSNNMIEFTTPRNTAGTVRLNLEAMFDYTPEELNKLDAWLNDEVIPVGYVHNELGIILASETSEFYMMANETMYKIGNNFLEALEIIVFEKDLEGY